MKPLFVLLGVFAVSLFASYLWQEAINLQLCGMIAMAAMLVFTSIGHFAFTEGMSMMIPPFFPYKKAIIILSGIAEIVLGIGLLIPGYYMLCGYLLIGLFILLIPANIYAAIHHVDYEKATYNGPGPIYLWFRIPLQIFFIGWIWFFIF